jgi:hypothetical protein
MQADPMVDLLALLDKREANKRRVGGSILDTVRIERNITVQAEAVLRSILRPAVSAILALHVSRDLNHSS